MNAQQSLLFVLFVLWKPCLSCKMLWATRVLTVPPKMWWALFRLFSAYSPVEWYQEVWLNICCKRDMARYGVLLLQYSKRTPCRVLPRKNSQRGKFVSMVCMLESGIGACSPGPSETILQSLKPDIIIVVPSLITQSWCTNHVYNSNSQIQKKK